jgi:hypothetical protein
MIFNERKRQIFEFLASQKWREVPIQAPKRCEPFEMIAARSSSLAPIIWAT